MSALDAVADAAQVRRDTEADMHDAVRSLHAAVRVAHDDRWRIKDITAASGMSRVTIHRIITAGTTADVIDTDGGMGQ